MGVGETVREGERWRERGGKERIERERRRKRARVNKRGREKQA